MRNTCYDSNNKTIYFLGNKDRSRSPSPNTDGPSSPDIPHRKESNFSYKHLNPDIENSIVSGKEDSSSQIISLFEQEVPSYYIEDKVYSSKLAEVCFLPPLVPCKQKIIQNVEKITEGKEKSYEEYYQSVIESGVDFIKLNSLTIYNEQNYREIQKSVLKLKEIMKSKKLEIPIMISMEYKVMRFASEISVNFKKGDTANFGFISQKQNDKQMKNSATNNKDLYMISNYDYMMMNKLTPGDKIIFNFGAANFFITKVHYKDGRVEEINNQDDDNHIDVEDSILAINYNELESEEHKIKHDCSAFNTNTDLETFLEKFYDNKKYQKVKKFSLNEEIEYIETVCLFDCTVNPNRPVLVMKKLKYDKYDYIPDLFFTYAEKLIKEVDFEYLILDFINDSISDFLNETLVKYNRKIPILLKITDFYTLNFVDFIRKNSVGVIISFNNLIKEIPFVDIVMMTEGLIKFFKKRGLAVYCHSQFLESLRKKNQPLPAEISDILFFLLSGVDGFNLGSETFSQNQSQNPLNALSKLRQLLKEMLKSLPTMKKLKTIQHMKTKDISQINSISLFNSLKKNENNILILISDDEKFLTCFLSMTLYNHIVLVTNKTSLIRKFLLFSITHCILVERITGEDEEEKDRVEKELLNKINEDRVVKYLNKKQDNSLIYCRCVKGENLETFSL